MGDHVALDLENLPPELQRLARAIEQAGRDRQGDEIALLELLLLL
ncbi:MAG: hypothetical protein AAF773_27185 [Cyanobacteria bacterium P01_D01_bin.115]